MEINLPGMSDKFTKYFQLFRRFLFLSKGYDARGFVGDL